MEELDYSESSAPEEARGKSLLDSIVSRREERMADESLTLDIPTWSGELKAKYRVVERVELEKMVRALRARQTRNGVTEGTMADADFLIRACIGVIAHDNETEEEQTIAPGYTKQLTELLGLEFERARDLVIYLFKGNGIAMAAHAMKVARWMQDTSRPIEDDGAGA